MDGDIPENDIKKVSGRIYVASVGQRKDLKLKGKLKGVRQISK